MTERVKVQKVKPLRLLQKKVGRGKVDRGKIKNSQAVINGNQTDFVPMALEYLEQLRKAVLEARKGRTSVKNQVQAIIVPVMQLKANAGMFGYELVTVLSGIVLDFLEDVKTINKDVLDVAETLHSTIQHIVDGRHKGGGGTAGRALKTELSEAIKRYYAKHGKKSAPTKS